MTYACGIALYPRSQFNILGKETADMSTLPPALARHIRRITLDVKVPFKADVEPVEFLQDMIEFFHGTSCAHVVPGLFHSKELTVNVDLIPCFQSTDSIHALATEVVLSQLLPLQTIRCKSVDFLVNNSLLETKSHRASSVRMT
jgi:hypothetical protein